MRRQRNIFKMKEQNKTPEKNYTKWRCKLIYQMQIKSSIYKDVMYT